MVETKQSESQQIEQASFSQLKQTSSFEGVKGWSKTYTLNNKLHMPAVGLGTWKSTEDKVYKAVKFALKSGYRHIDCAEAYGNQDQVGRAISDAMKEYNIKRSEIWVTSKLWLTCFEPERAREALKRTLKDLQLEYLDLYLLHWPVALEYNENEILGVPKDDEGYLKLSYCPLYKTWAQMEKFVEEGLVKSIGISNFEPSNIFDLLSYAKIKPAVNQVEFHPLFNRKELQQICEHFQIHMTAYSPFGNGVKEMFELPELKKLADKYNKSVGQIIIRWLVQHNVSTIPKSVHEDRLEQNLDVFDFELTSDEMKSIDSLDKHMRTCDTRRKDYWNIAFNDA
jgi:diketogulonate reductase-like aldo/keto reductase